MKRAMPTLGALAVIIGFFFAAPAAHATHNNAPPVPAAGLGCVLVTAGTKWPTNGHYYYCGSTPAILSAAGNYVLPDHLKTKLHTANAYLFVWADAAQFDKYRGANLAGEYRLYGVTGEWLPSGLSGPTFITINLFENVPGHGSCTRQQLCTLTQSQFANAMHHEMGHALDLAYNDPSINSAIFDPGVLGPDWTFINGLAQSAMFPNGIPTKRFVYATGQWVNYTPPPVGTPERNQIILEELIPGIFHNEPTYEQARRELWANLFQQFRGGHANFDYPNPYGTQYPGNPNGSKTLSDYQIFSKFRMTIRGQNPKKYFDKLWTPPPPTFVP